MRLPSDHDLEKLQEAVRLRIGFDPRSVGHQSFQRTVCQRMAELHVLEGSCYVARLLSDEAEFEAFVEELVVPETWFFRDRQPFHCIQHYATQHWRPAPFGDHLRILSIPCSTGEEPYSIAMALLDVGLLPSQFHVDGADVSRRALQQAAEGVYGKSSFRNDEAAFPGLSERFVDRQGDAYVVNASLRETVRFLHANLISPALLENQPRYHIVLCRNVLIYLNTEARQVALANLHRLLSPDGLLYVGHVEARLAAEGAFCPFHAKFPFAFTPASDNRRKAAAHHVVPSAASALASGPAPKRLVTTAHRSTGSRSVTTPSLQTQHRTWPGEASAGVTGAEPAEDVDSSTEKRRASTDVSVALAAARAAANCGRLEEAVAICQDILADDRTNADALCLMGLAFKARGQTIEAENFFQQVLYLEPRHEESLIHMMLIAQQQGNEKSASNFRRRAEQVHRREGTR